MGKNLIVLVLFFMVTCLLTIKCDDEQNGSQRLPIFLRTDRDYRPLQVRKKNFIFQIL